MSVVERKIFFYRIHSNEKDDTGHPRKIDIPETLKDLAALPFDKTGRYMAHDATGNEYCAWLEKSDVEARQLVFGAVRRKGLPQMDDAGGHLSPLPIPDGAGLIEPIHVVFFDDGVVGSEFNFYGPRMSRLTQYLQVKCPDTFSGCWFDQLLRGDAIAELEQFSEISLVQLAIHAQDIETLRGANESLHEAFKSVANFGDPQKVEIVLRSGRKVPFGATVKKRLLRLLTSGSYRTLDKFVVSGKTGAARADIDLLWDKLIATKKIMTLGERTRALDDKAAFVAIRQAHTELKTDLKDAKGLGE
jgi:hypothetical protein